MSTPAQTRLSLYQQALDDIVTNKRVSEIIVDGERVKFTDANIDQLNKLVQQAKTAVIAEQIANRRNKVKYWGFGGRD